MLGPEKRGYFGLIIMASSLLFSLGHFGFGSAIAYFTGERNYSRNKILSFVFAVPFILGSFMAIIFFFIYPYIKDIWTGIPPSLMLIGLIAIPFYFLHNFLIRFLMADLKIREANITRILNSLFYLVLVIIIVWIFNGGIKEAIICYTVSFIAASLLAFILFTKEYRPMAKIDFSMTGPFFRYGIKVYLILIFNFLNYKLDIFLVKYFLTASDVSYYQIAASIAQRFWYIPNAMSALLFPTLMAMNKGTSKFTARLCRNNLFLMVPLAILALFIIHPAVILLYGKEYEAVAYALYSILWGITIFPIYKFLASYFASKKKLGIGIFASTIGLIINVIANIFLIPRLGIIGAGIATSISYSVLSIILLIFFRIQTKIKLRKILVPDKEDFKKYIKLAKKGFQHIRSIVNKNNRSNLSE